jgi:beta-mannanase
MNGDWYPWSQHMDPRQTPEDYVRAWRHLHYMFAAQGVRNVRWMWCPNCEPVEGLERLYPGDRYVDWIGIDVYNRPKWPRSPREAIDPVYEFAARHGKPILLAEVGCAQAFAEAGDQRSPWVDKEQWITALFAEFGRWPRIRGIIWFDVSKEADWRIGSSPEAAAAYRKAVLRLDSTGTSGR